MKKRLAILGVTGSIGSSALDIVKDSADFEVILLSAHRDARKLTEIAHDYPKAKTVLTDSEAALDHEINFRGPEGLRKALHESAPDIVLNGIAGAAGLTPSVITLELGADLALANKESVVMAGPLIFSIAQEKHAKILPVDSEHSAIFQLSEAHGHDSIEEIVLTASGGPFRGYDKEQLREVSVEDALAHPTWSMGGKITIDSATLANKGLEVIEAIQLFDMPPEQVRVVIHPQSFVHSLIRLRDGSLYAQISKPDMRLPIHNALYWPNCVPCGFGRLELEGNCFVFEKVAYDTFPMLALAYVAARSGPLYPTVFNAANEIAVSAFFDRRIAFTDIPVLTQAALEKDWTGKADTLDFILETDTRAREIAKSILRELTS